MATEVEHLRAEGDPNNGTDEGEAPAERVIEIPLQSQELLVINLEELSDDSPAEIAELLRSERTPVKYWLAIIDEYYRRGRLDVATRLAELGLQAFKERDERDPALVQLHCLLASYALLQSRSAPRTVIPNPRQYHVKSEVKNYFTSKAAEHIAAAELLEPQSGFVLDTKANAYLLTNKFDEAYRTYEFIISKNPSHLFALMGKARIHYVRRQFRVALKLYQSVLSAAPDFLPDPRIGIGLCFWNLGEHRLARRAWARSAARNPGKASSGASLLLGLSYLNTARDPRLEDEERAETYSDGIRHIQTAWASDKTCAATAAALSGYFLVSSNKWDTVIKLAELAIQHGDARAVISEGQLAIARALHAQDKVEDATRHYLLAAESNPDQIVASLGIGQTYVRKKDYPAAINQYENILRKQPGCVEALANLASLHARAAFATSSIATGSATDASSDQSKARELFDQLVTLFQSRPGGTAEQPGSLDPLGQRIQQIARDPDLYVEIARLWTGLDLSKALNAYRQSYQVHSDNIEDVSPEETDNTMLKESIPPHLLCNIGSLEYGRGQYESAQERFEEAIRLDLARQQAQESRGATLPEGDAVMMTLMYNLGVVMEARGQKEEAAQLYEQRLLARHPEYIEAKARLAALALADKQHERCSEFLKAALTAQPGHLDLRALYVYFLVDIGNVSAAKDFAVMTLKDFNKTDVYAMSAMAHLLYQQARENKDNRPEAVKDRTSRYFRACEAFDRVLQLDPNCLFAAQGVAIALAENNLGAKPIISSASNPALQATNEAAQRARNLRDALTILAKARESANNGDVYVNIGLCHFMREEFDKAIESLETANNRFYFNKHLPTLLYLSRARFHKANKDQDFSVLQAALEAALAAASLASSDDTILFNISLIRQRGLELLQALPASKRRLSEIKTALADAELAQETFATLADNKNTNVGYSTDLADQRRRYGEGLIKRAATTLSEQEDWEQNEQNKVEIAKRDREAERARQAEIERRKREEAQRQAEELAAQRRQMLEDSKTWYQKPIEEEGSGDEDKPKKGKGRKKKEDEGIVPDGEGEETVDGKSKKRRKTGEGRRKKKDKGEEEANTVANGAQSDGHGDEDDEDAIKRPSKRKKGQSFRTPAMIEDSDVEE